MSASSEHSNLRRLLPAALRVAVRLAVPAVALTVAAGCAKQADRFALDRVFARAVVVPDLDRGCAVGNALGYTLEAASSAENPPIRGRIMSDASAALCAEDAVREAQLAAARVEANFEELSPQAQIALIKDAREREERAHQLAALRYARAWDGMQEAWGPVGESCPKIKEKDEIAYLMGLNAGVNGLLHDRASGGTLGIPLDTLLKVARASECLDNERWWYVPQAMRAAAWATVPGSGPEGVDPWELLEEAASTGDDSGIRLARAVQVVIGANNGQPEVVRSGIRAFAESRAATPSAGTHALFDDYAMILVRHESDLIWTEAEGHRTLDLGELPGDEAAVGAGGADPFGGDPFGAGGDPFGAPAEGGGGDPFGAPAEGEGAEGEGAEGETASEGADEAGEGSQAANQDTQDAAPEEDGQ